MSRIHDQTYLIVGASSDIGEQLCHALAKTKAHCILLDKESKKLDALYDEMLALGAASVLLCPLERLTANPAQYQEIAGHLQQHYAKINAIFFTEGAYIGLTPLEHYDETKWLSVLQVNLNAAFLICKTMLPLLKQVSKAQIIFTESVAANSNKAYWGAHTVSEYGIRGLCEVINAEHAPQISAHVIAPGPVRCQQRLKAFPAEDTSHLLEISAIIPLYLDLLDVCQEYNKPN